MKFLSLLLLLSTSAFAASGSSNVSDVVSIGGVDIVDLSGSNFSSNSSAFVPISSIQNVKMLIGYKNSLPGATSFIKLYDSTNMTGNQYQAGGTEGFYAIKICSQNFAAGGGYANDDVFQVGYADTALSSNTTSTVPTNPKYWSGSSTGVVGFSLRNRNMCQDVSGLIHTGKYGFIVSGGGHFPDFYTVFGFEK